MECKFRFCMDFFGKHFSRCKMYEGDFHSWEQFITVEESTRPSDAPTMKAISMSEYVKELINEAE